MKDIFAKSEKVLLTGKDLTIELVHKVAYSSKGQIKLEIAPDSLKRMYESRDYVEKVVSKGKPVYGINTGFGALSNQHIQHSDLEKLQFNLIRSHCTGVGAPFSKELTKAIMLLRANCLIGGNSGVTPSIVELLLDFINHEILPVIPQKGSVGASGDLAPLSHMALALIGEGPVIFDGKRGRSDFAISTIGKKPASLGAKDGLALINGTAVMAALGAVAVVEGERLSKLADICAALTLDGVKGTTKAYDPLISSLKPHKGQIASTNNLNLLLEGSEIKDSHDNCGKVQDPYSLRCVPQVHGACRQTIAHARDVITTELNSVTDNPLIFIEEDKIISGGNFHGEALALCMDYMAMGIAELCSISERRIEKMMNPTFSSLPSFLIEGSGLNSGLMIAHVTAAALTSENKSLCHPASVDSVPTSTDKEDHVSMGVTSGRKLHEVISNLRHVLSIEILCNSQALDFQRPLKSSKALEAAHSLIRMHVPVIDEDRIFYKDIENISNLIQSNEILTTIEKITGGLA